MSEKHLHIIALNIPYPTNYGGVVDIFYKMKALYNHGVKIILHCFDYGRGEQPELNKYCEKVLYYKRNTNFINSLKSEPYIVTSRKNKQLLHDLLLDDYPILFEGIHTCYYLTDSRLQNRLKIVRAHNIETDYYANLAKNEKCFWRKLFFQTESKKLKKYEQNLQFSDLVFAVTQKDADFFSTFCRNVYTIPVFHTNEEVTVATGRGTYILYHGDLTSNENLTAVHYLIDNVFSKIEMPVVIAGLNPPKYLRHYCKQFSNIQINCNPSVETIHGLIQNAQINVMITFQPTGLKLKLLHALSSGRFCMVNSLMLHGTELQELCIVADTPEMMIEKIHEIFFKEFDFQMVTNREKIFNQLHSNYLFAEKMIELIF